MTKLQHEMTRPNVWHTVVTTIGQIFRWIPPIYFIFAAMMIGIGLTNPNFFSHHRNMLNLLLQAAPLAILAAGQLYVIVSGSFDLSVGSIITFVVLGSSILLSGNPDATYWVILMMLGIGVGVGLLNGAITHYLKVPSIITTLGMMLTIKGAALLWSGGAPRGSLPPAFRVFGRDRMEKFLIWERFPYAVLILIGIGIIATLLLHKTNFGKQVYAVGDNPRAAALAGINVPLVRMTCFALSGLFAAIAGVLLGGFSGVSNQVGDGYELRAITAVVLGGARLLGGRGGMPEAIMGAISLQALFTLLNNLGLPQPLREAVQAVILITAAAYAVLRERRKA